jgi:NAD(P)-dependent dehydrogenase (short-subunit alcohol dehydrogenase family)
MGRSVAAEALSGRIAVVSGAGGGIGRAVCRLFLDAGARVVALYRDPKAYDGLREEVAGHERLSGLRVDLAREAEIGAAVERIGRDPGSVDVLVNGAGVGFFGPIETISSAQWREMLDVNLTGTFLLIRGVVPLMKSHGGGVIVNIASVTGLRGYPKCSAYGATKAGVIGLTRSLAEELIPAGIRVVAVSPGSVDTPFQDNIPKHLPREKMIRPADVARAVLFAAALPDRAMLGDVVIRPRVIG